MRGSCTDSGRRIARRRVRSVWCRTTAERSSPQYGLATARTLPTRVRSRRLTDDPCFRPSNANHPYRDAADRVLPMHHQSLQRRSSNPTESRDVGDLFVSDESLVLRNYDSDDTHDVAVSLLDAVDDLAFDRRYTLSPGSVLSVATRLERAVYRVEVRLDGTAHAHAECLIGSGPGETALVEIGNGLVSVSEGAV